MQTKRENRGGARSGAGRPRECLSINMVRELLKTAKKYADDYGKSIEDILLDMIYGVNEQRSLTNKEQLAAIKLFMDRVYIDDLVVDPGALEPEAQDMGRPGIYLPERRPDPAKVIPINDEVKY